MTSIAPVLTITDGTTEIDLLDKNGFLLYEWVPGIPEAKGGGVWSDSPITEGRKLAYRQLGNIVETFDMKVRGYNQDDAIYNLQELRRLLEKAIEYWTSDAQNEPVYIAAKAAWETNTRYAIIFDYRTPRDSNPFIQPFFSCNPLVDNFILAIEHGIWQDSVPGSSTCVEISTEQEFLYDIANIAKRPTANSDDAYTIGPGPATIVFNNNLYVGYAGGGAHYDLGVRFTNVTIPNGATISRAWIDFVSIHAISDFCEGLIKGESADNAAAFTTYANFVGRSLDSPTTWTIGSAAPGNIISTPDITSHIQDIVNRPGWVSGNALAIFVMDNGINTNWRGFASYDHSSYSEPVLYVEYSTNVPTVFGHSAGCNEAEFFVVNKHNRANLTHIYTYDLSITTFSTNLITSATPFAFLPAVPAAGDIVYFGISTAFGDSGPFNNLVFDISTAQANITTIVWEYYNGGWVTLTVQDNTGTIPFNYTDVQSVHWVQPSDWTTVAINGVTAWWVRARVTAVGGGPTPPYQDNREIYSCVWPFVELQAAQVEGDIPALARIRLTNRSDASGGSPDLRSNRIIVGARSLSRGTNFTPYLNISDEQNPSGVTVALGANTAYSASSITPTGRLATYTSPAAVGTTTEVTITLSSIISPEYLGRFRAFLRYEYDTGAADAVSMRLITTPGGSGLAKYSEYVFPQVNTAWQVADFGIVNIPSRASGDQYGTITFSVEITRDTGGRIIYLHELILMPVDEWSTDAVDESGLAVRTGAIGYDDLLDIDSISYPREIDQAVMRTASTGRVIGYFQNRQSGPALLQTNRAQRLWFFCISYESGTELSSWISVSHTIQVYRVQRYLSARGRR